MSEGAEWGRADRAVFEGLTNETRYVLIINIRTEGEHQGSYSSHDAFSVLLAAIFRTSLSSTDYDQTSHGTLKTEFVFGIFDLDSHTMVGIASAETKLRRNGDTVHILESQPGTVTTPAPQAPIQ